MLIYMTGTENQKLIENAIYEIQMENTLCIGEPIKSNDINLLAEVKSTLCKNKDISTLLIDLSVISNDDDEIIKAFKTLRYYNDNCRFIIVATEREVGDKLLSELVNMGIYNIVNNEDDMISKISYYALEEATYKEASIFQIKDIEEDTDSKGKRKTKTEKLTKKAKAEKTKVILKPLKQKITISVIGSQNRVGVTHTCISLAYTLVKKGNRVAVIELNENDDFKWLSNCYEHETLSNEIGQFIKIYQIDFYKNVSIQTLSKIQGLNYDYIIIDGGKINECAIAEHNRCDLKLVVFGSKAWEQQYLGQLFDFCGNEISNTYKYITLCDEKLKKEIVEELKPCEVFFPTYSPEPFNEDKELLNVLKGYLYEEEVKTKKGLFALFSK